MSNKQGFVLVESILLFQIVCIIVLLVCSIARLYHSFERASKAWDTQEEKVKAIYE